MADTPAFDLEEDLFSPNLGMSSGSNVTSEMESALQNFVTLNYDTHMEWMRDRAQVDLIAKLHGSLSEQMVIAIEAKIQQTYPSRFQFGPARSSDVPPAPSRLDRIVALLTRQESLSLLNQLSGVTGAEAVHSRLMRFLLTSNRHLHTFAALVDEDLVGLDEAGLLRVSEVGERVLREIARNTDSA